MTFLRSVRFAGVLSALVLSAACSSSNGATSSPDASVGTVRCSTAGGGKASFDCSMQFSNCADGHTYEIDCEAVPGNCTCVVDGTPGATFPASEAVVITDAGDRLCESKRIKPPANARCGWSLL